MKIWVHAAKLADLCGGKTPLLNAEDFKPVSPAKVRKVKWENVQPIDSDWPGEADG